MSEEFKLLGLVMLFVVAIGTGATIEGYLDKQQEIELAKARCSK